MAQTLNIEFHDKKLVPLLFGEHNAHISYIEKVLDVSIADRGATLQISGESSNVKRAEKIIHDLWARLEHGDSVGTAEIDAAIRFDADKGSPQKDLDKITIKTKRKNIAPRSPNQGKYLNAMQSHDMVFGLGPAGTGKTYLAVAMGVSMYLRGEVERLIFTRPAVEAGEHLGFLPGDMQEKVDPYVRPIYDALHDMLPLDFLEKKREAGDIEVAPLAFMRGRTLANAFVILDEAQNTSVMQMKMFLTRMGENTRMVITGDPSQVDLPSGQKSGLRDAQDTLRGIDEIYFHHFSASDVVRHKLVGKIVKAYEHRD